MRRSFARGSAMPETALVMSAVLLIFLGLIKVAAVGYQQSETDAAAFVAAHEGSFGSNAANQASYGRSTAQNVFSSGGHTHFSGTGNSVSATPVPASGLNPYGNIVGNATHASGGLWLNQAFGGSVFSLHSFFIEPLASTPFIPGDSSFIVTQANPPNCTTNNTATPTCSDLSASFATPNPSNTKDPFYTYACHALYYAYLSNSSGFSPNPNTYFAPQTEDLFSQYPGSAIDYVLPDNASLMSLTDENGTSLYNGGNGNNEPWPLDFQPTASDGINNAAQRASGTWLTTQYEPNGTTPDPANADGNATKGGNLGTALVPIFDFGSGSDKC